MDSQDFLATRPTATMMFNILNPLPCFLGEGSTNLSIKIEVEIEKVKEKMKCASCNDWFSFQSCCEEGRVRHLAELQQSGSGSEYNS